MPQSEIVPVQTDDLAPLQELEYPQESQTDIYEYQRADGTLETANSVEEAMRRCPILGGMAMEQAGIMLELAAIGRAKRAEEAQPIEPTPTESVAHGISNLESNIKTQAVIASLVYESKSEINVTLQEEIDNSAKIAETITAEQSHIEHVIESISVQTSAEEEPARHEVRPVQSIIQIAEKIEINPESRSEVVVTPIAEKSDVATLVAIEASTTLDVQIDEEPQATHELMQRTELLDQESETANEAAIVSLTSEEVLERLLHISTEPRSAQETVVLLEYDDQVLQDIGSDDFINEFETFSLALDKEYQDFSVEAIKEHACDQPLEQTLAELAQYLISKEEDLEKLEIVDLLRRLQNDAINIIDADGKLDISELTTEMVNDLVRLVGEFGYDNPGQALIEMVLRHDIEFLVQFIRYLAQLANEDNRQEFMHYMPQRHRLILSNGSVVSRWGRAMIGLLGQAYETSNV